MELSFREKKFSKINKGRILALFFVFILSVIVFSIVLNYRKISELSDVSGPALPIVNVEALGETLNELHGYVTEMDACYMRDAVVPLQENRQLPIHILTYGNTIDSIRYEIRSTDTTRKIAETEIFDYVQADDMITVTPVIENLVNQGEEYLLVITLGTGGREVYYYTRILQPEDAHEQECLDFVKDFHNTALSDNYESLATYLEPKYDDTAASLSHVTISSPLSNVGWKGFVGEVVDDPVIEMKDVNSDYSAIVMYYQMQGTDGENPKYYNVQEYFKVRYGEERFYLLDYERTMEQIFDIAGFDISENTITLGAHVSDLSYLSNETGSIVAFVQSGGLYEYNQNTRVMTRVFDFRRGEDDILDPRTNYDDHGIMILNIDESGTMDFVVYGYMNSGAHEGQCGIDLYHYDAALAVANEQVFISSTNSYQILKARFSDLLYLSTDHIFYIMVDGTLLQVDLNTLKTTEIVSSLADGQFASSRSSRYFAWMDNEDVADVIHIMDLEDQSTFDLSADQGEALRPLDFIDEDFVYGYVRKTDISTDAAGTTTYPMYKLQIRQVDSENGSVLKEYEKSGYYVISAEKEENTTLILERVVKEPDGYVAATEDTIRNTSGETNKEVEVALREDEAIGYVLTITMAQQQVTGKITGRDAGLSLADEDMNIGISVGAKEEKYFAYVGSSVIFAGGDLTRAIQAADEQMGIVVDSDQRYIWKRGKAAIKNNITGISVGNSDREASSQAQCISALMLMQGENVEVNQLLAQGQTPITILQNTLRKSMILDLTGCTMQEVLYYVNLGNPVYARTGDGEAVLIIGYDTFNITVFDPNIGENKKLGLNDSAELFESQGNVFISYLQ